MYLFYELDLMCLYIELHVLDLVHQKYQSGGTDTEIIMSTER